MQWLRRAALLFLFALTLSGADRWIVELSEEPVAARPGKERLAAVRGQQARLSAELESRRVRVLGRMQHVVNAVAVEAGSAAELAGLPGVKAVHPVRQHRLHLGEAIQYHRLTEAVRIGGEAAAGRGVKIAIIDTGIDVTHPGMQDAELEPPEGFPKVNDERDLEHTNGKVIVARSYAPSFQNREEDLSARDRIGHGTGAAMAAAGAPNRGPLGAVVGAAPKAWLGNYKIFGSAGVNDTTTTDLILKALDDAVGDGMDVVNLSLGDSVAPVLEADLEAQAVARAAEAGVIVVVSAGNSGPDQNTIGSPGTSPAAITVGALRNARFFGTTAVVQGAPPYIVTPGTGPRPAQPVRADLRDVATLDPSGLACESLPGGSLTGKVALILRGVCTFRTKLVNAERAGATAAVVYTSSDRPVNTMDVQDAQLPAVMIAYADGIDLKERLAANGEFQITINFSLQPVARNPGELASFSSVGPSVNNAIKPEVLAVGQDLYTATQRAVANTRLWDETGYRVMNGTSFSAPIVAGLAAALKAARPSLTVDQYRSLVVSSALPVGGEIQQAGAGAVDAESALYSQLTLLPVSLSFGAGAGNPNITRDLQVTNVGLDPVEYRISVEPYGQQPAPRLKEDRVALAPGQTATLPVEWRASDLAPGIYQGRIVFTHAETTHMQRVPYWYAVTSVEPGSISILDQEFSGRPGDLLRNAFFFRILESSGVPVTAVTPEVTVAEGAGSVVRVDRLGSIYPGVFRVQARLGAGVNVFRIRAGAVVREVTIAGL